MRELRRQHIVLADITNGFTNGALIGSTSAGSVISASRGYSYAGTFGTWPTFTGVALADVATALVPAAAARVVSAP